MFDYILFDFDGTLFNTSGGVFKAFDHVVKTYKLVIEDKSVYNTMIGPPLRESFARVFHMKDDEIDAATVVYRDYYQNMGGMFDVIPYDGIVDAIKALRKAGKKILVATSKPELYARQILEKENMLDLFDFVGGSDLGEKLRVNKVDVIRYVLETQNITDKKDKCVMVGDTHFDIDGAKAAGLKSIGVLFGFGSLADLQKAGADYIAEKPSHIVPLCLGNAE